jgi:hypothetical protein
MEKKEKNKNVVSTKETTWVGHLPKDMRDVVNRKKRRSSKLGSLQKKDQRFLILSISEVENLTA